MRSTKIILAVVLLALFAGCRTSPIYTVNESPVVVTSNKNVTLDDVSKAIIRAGVKLGWQIDAVKPGHSVGTLKLRNHVAVVDILYNTKSFSIKYKDSTNLDYKDDTIHSNYNGWVQNLEKGIRAELVTM